MLNATKVNQQIRKSNQLHWERKNGQDILLNGYWLIKADLSKENYRKILGLLVEIFGFIPAEGEMWKKSKWIGAEIKKQRFDYSELIKVPDTKIVDSKLEYQVYAKGNARIFKGEDYIYVNTEYVNMIKNNDEIVFYGDEEFKPIYATKEDDMIIILPIRMASEDNKYLKEIEPIATTQIGSEKKYY